MQGNVHPFHTYYATIFLSDKFDFLQTNSLIWKTLVEKIFQLIYMNL